MIPRPQLPDWRKRATWAGGEVIRQRKIARLKEIRPQILDMLHKRYLLIEIAQKLNLSPMTITNYIKEDPELKAVAQEYVKRGGHVKRNQ